MNWTHVHAVLRHMVDVDMPKAEQEYKTAIAELEAYTKQRGRKALQMKRVETFVRVDRLANAIKAISALRLGDTVDDSE